MKTIALSLSLLLAGITFVKCTTTVEPLTMEEEKAKLEKLYDEIVELSQSETCSNPDNWKYTAIGSKACGGPTGYIAYPKSIDESNFLSLVEDYTLTQKSYNEKSGMMSDCSLPAEPTGITCEDGKAKLVYSGL